MTRTIILSFILAFGMAYPTHGQMKLFVSPQGSPTASGTQDDPLRSPADARDRIRSFRSSGEVEEGTIEVILEPGRYTLTSTLELTMEDSGTPHFPIHYRCPNGQAILSGGVPCLDWQPLTRNDLLDRLPEIAKSHVIALDLAQMGVNPGLLQPLRLNETMPVAPIELSLDTQSLPRAGWPNDGWATVRSPSSSRRMNRWLLDHPVPTTETNNAWAFGFWSNDWSTSFEPIRLDGNRREASLDPTSIVHEVQVGARYRLSNLLSELDAPGEWVIDEASGLLLYWPLENRSPTEVVASNLETVLSLYDVENVVFEGCRIESARSMGIEVVGGCDVVFRHCSIVHAGNVGVHFFRGKHHALIDCEVAFTGSSAIRVEGGDRSTLTVSEHVVDGCNIHDFSQRYLGRRAGIALYGVGSRVANSHIHHGPDAAIQLFGNEHVVENNEIDLVCRDTDDTGAVYLSFDPTFRGNVIRRNFIHDLGGFSQRNVVGIYLDDFISGTVVEENYLLRTVRGVVVGGGRDNVIASNIIEGGLAAIQLDARGGSWARKSIEGDESPVVKLYKETLVDSPAIAERYPALDRWNEEQPSLPLGNVIRDNLFDTPIGIDLQDLDRGLVSIDGNSKYPPNTLVRESERARNLLAEWGLSDERDRSAVKTVARTR